MVRNGYKKEQNKNTQSKQDIEGTILCLIPIRTK